MVNNGLELLFLKKFIPDIIGRDKFLKTMALLKKVLLILLNTKLISTSPNVTIVAFDVSLADSPPSLHLVQWINLSPFDSS